MKTYSRLSAAKALTGALLLVGGLLLSVIAPVLVAPLHAQSPGEARFEAGKAAFDRGDFDAAADAFGDAIKVDKDNSRYHLWLGNAYAQKAIRSGMITKARLAPRMHDEWTRAAELDPTSFEPHEYLYQFYTKAPGFLGGSTDKARAEVAVMMRLDPYKATMLSALEEVGDQRYADGESRMRALIALYPDSADIPVKLAVAQQNAKHYDDAWSTLDAAHARFPNNAMIDYMIGRGAALSGTRLDAGVAALDHAIAAAPGKLDSSLDSSYVSPAHYRLGVILQRRGDTSGARVQYATALELNPNNAEAKQALGKLGTR